MLLTFIVWLFFAEAFTCPIVLTAGLIRFGEDGHGWMSLAGLELHCAGNWWQAEWWLRVRSLPLSPVLDRTRSIVLSALCCQCRGCRAQDNGIFRSVGTNHGNGSVRGNKITWKLWTRFRSASFAPSPTRRSLCPRRQPQRRTPFRRCATRSTRCSCRCLHFCTPSLPSLSPPFIYCIVASRAYQLTPTPRRR